jgi:hypothetical protein
MPHGEVVALLLIRRNATAARFVGFYVLTELFTPVHQGSLRLITIIAKDVEFVPKSAGRKPFEWRVRDYNGSRKSFFIWE